MLREKNKLNSIRFKFECLRDIIGHNIDILLISETKLNDTFPEGQFFIPGFHTPFRNDRNDKGGGLHFSFRITFPVGDLLNLNPIIEAIVVEINRKKRTQLLHT